MARVITRPRRFREVALMGRLATFLYIITAPYEGAVIIFSEYRLSNRCQGDRMSYTNSKP